MLSGVGFVIARVTFVLALSFILSKSLPSIPYKMLRFACLFILLVPFGLLYDYVKAQLLGHHYEMSWSFTIVWALACAVVLTFWEPQVRKSNTL